MMRLSKAFAFFSFIFLASAQACGWTLELSADNQLEPVTIGIDPGASDGFDDYDSYTETPVQGKVIMILDGLYSTEINRARMTWELTVGVPVGESASIKWDPSGIPSYIALTINGTDMKATDHVHASEGDNYYTIVAHEVSQTTTSTTRVTTSTTPGQKSGDADGDGSVDYNDLLILAASYGKTTGSDGYDGRADYNGDGRVDYSDLLILATNYLR